MNFRFFTLPLLALIVVGSVNSGTAADAAKKKATESLGSMSEPFATGLDVHSFNPPEGEKSDRETGEILSLFEEFLEAQGISREWRETDLEALIQLMQRDVSLSRAREDYLDDRYDELKEEFEELEEFLLDNGKDGKEKAGKKKVTMNRETAIAEYVRLREKAAPFRAERNVLRKYLSLEEPALASLYRARSAPQNSKLRYEACDEAARTLYSLFAEQLMDERKGVLFPQDFRFKVSMVRQFVDRANLNSTQMMNPAAQRKRLLRGHGAEREAANLVFPSRPDRFVSVEEMASLTHGEVAALDVAPTNPMWYSRRHMREVRPDTWGQLEAWLSRRVSEELLDKKKFRKKYPNFSYNLTAARRVLFWSDIKISATSPKVDVKDAFGKSWKLKWSEECAIEPVANRIKLLLGKKFTDLVYNDVGGSSHLLVLPSELQKRMRPDKTMPTTKEALIDALLESKYEFNLRPFIHSHGVITAQNADSVLGGLPGEALSRYEPEKLIGRVWIRFKESMVEAKHDAFVTGGPVTTYTDFASRDRAIRQMMIAAFWLEEIDVKEDNFKSVVLKDFGGVGGNQYLEYFHDSGSGLGGAPRSGEVNKLSVDLGSGGFMWTSPTGRLVFSNAFQLYRPSAWNHVTYADHRAGAEHVTRLTRSQIEKAVSHSLQPDFYQKCLSWKLTRRRDLIAKHFRLGLPDEGAGPPPQVSIELTSRPERIAAARLYCIPLHEIENDLVRMGHLQDSNRAGDTVEPFIDRIVIDGMIQPYEKTVIPGILRDFRYPAGFVERMSRFDDGGPWQSLRLGIQPEK